MAFPVILQGAEGEQFSTYTDARWPLGTQLVLQDGRKFRFSKAGGSTLAAGDVQGSYLVLTTHIDMAGVAGSATALGRVGDPGGSVTTGAAALVANLFAQGYAMTSVTPDVGRVYRINNHLANAGSAAMILNFDVGYTIGTAWTTSTRVHITKNKFDAIIQFPATVTNTGTVVGVACSAPTTGVFCWVATAGPAAVLMSGTVLKGEPAATGVAAGALSPLSATIATTLTQIVCGVAMSDVASTARNLINLTLD